MVKKVASFIDSNIRIAVPYSSVDRTILELGDIPRLFKMFPLAETKDLVFPAVIDAPFRVSEERFGLEYRDAQIRELEDILRKVADVMRELCVWVLNNDIQHKQRLFKIREPPDKWPQGAHKELWVRSLSNLVRDISRLKAVEVAIDLETSRKEFLEPEFVYFPSPCVGSYSFEDEKFILRIWGLSHHLGLKVPVKGLIKEWNDIRTCWESLKVTIGKEQTFENLVKRVEKIGSLNSLKKETPLDTDEKAITFLKYFYKLGNYYRSQRKHVPEFLREAIYCNQKGIFKKPMELMIDKNVPNNLKKISDDLFEPLCEKLLNTEFSKDDDLEQHFQALGLETMDEKRAIGLLYDSVHRNWKQRSRLMEKGAYKYKLGIMEFEKWLLQNKDIEPLLEKYPLHELPFLCEDNELRIAEKEYEYFVLPDLFLEEEAKEHTPIWPSDAKLSKGYSQGITESILVKDRLVASRISKPGLSFSEETELSSDQIRKLGGGPIKDEYAVTTDVSKIIALNKVLEAAGHSKNPELTKAIVNFILGYVVPRDNSWQELKTVRASSVGYNVYGRPVSTGKERDIRIYPSLWLLQMKQGKWVATPSLDDKGEQSFDVKELSRDNLIDYLKTLKPSILGDEKVALFLQQNFGFSLIEIAGWRLSGGKSEKEQALIESFTQIYELADSKGVDPIDFLNEMLFERWRSDQFNRRNTNFGKLIERAVCKAFEKLKFREYGFEVIPRWKGYDFEAYLSKQIEEFDYGTLSITVEKIPNRIILRRFDVEVKATRVDTVTMTLTQASNAVDYSERYLLCVVDTKNLSEDLTNLDSTLLSDEQIEKISEEILPRMSIMSIGQDLRQVITEFRNASSATPDIKVNYDARFTIPSKLWRTKGKTIANWFILILHELGVSIINEQKGEIRV